MCCNQHLSLHPTFSVGTKHNAIIYSTETEVLFVINEPIIPNFLFHNSELNGIQNECAIELPKLRSRRHCDIVFYVIQEYKKITHEGVGFETSF